METIFGQTATYLWTQSAQIAVLFVLVGAACFALRKRTSHLRYLLWLLIVAKCLAPSLVTVSLAILPNEPETPRAAAVEPVMPILIEMPPAVLETRYVASVPSTFIEPKPAEPSIVERLSEIGPKTWFGMIWLAGLGVFTVVVLAKAARIHHHLKSNRRPVNEALQHEAHEILTAAGKAPRLWLVGGTGQPFVWGLVRGSVYLPANFTRSTDRAHRRKILAHELAHVGRFDALVNVLQTIAQAIFWFHPLVWIANRSIRAEREKCCDETAIARLATSPRDYSTAIVDTLINEYKSTLPTPSLAIAGPIKNIEDRIKTIMKPGKRFYKRPTVIAIATICFLAAVVVPTTIALTERTEKVDETSGDLTDAPLSDLPEQVRAEIEKLWSTDTGQRANAVMRLRSMGMRGKADAAVPYLTDMLGDDSKYPEMVLMASSLSSLTRSCSSEYTFGSEAAETIARIGKKSDRLLTLLESYDWKICADATRAIGGLKDTRAADTLIAFVRDKNKHPYVRGNAALAIALLKDDRAVAPLIDALNDDEAVVRRSVASALGDFGGPRVAEPLMALLADTDPQVRIAATIALGGVKESDVIPALLEALGDEHRQVREVAARALSRQPDARSLQPLIEALSDDYPNTRAAAAEALGELKDARVFEPLIETLKDDNEYVRWHAASALGNLKDSRAVEPLIAVAMNDKHIARIRAIGALGRLGDSRAIDALVDILKDNDTVIRRNARDALMKLTGRTHRAEYDAWKDWSEKNKGGIAAEEADKAAVLSAVADEIKVASLEGITFVATVDMRNIDKYRSLGIGGGFGNRQPICDFIARANYVAKHGNSIKKGDRFVIASAEVVDSTDTFGNSGTKLILRSASPKEGLILFCYGYDSADKSFWAIDREKIRQAIKGYFIIAEKDPTTELGGADDVKAQIQVLEGLIGAVETLCVPAKRTLRDAVQRRFGKGVAVNSANDLSEVDDPASRYRLYEFCENGSLLVCYDSESLAEVEWARYIELYPMGNRSEPLTDEEKLPRLRLRQEQMQLIFAEYTKRFGEDKTAAWGEAADDVRVRLRDDRKSWPVGSDPSFQFDIGNQSNRTLSIAYPQLFKVEVDGQWHEANYFASGEPRSIGTGGQMTCSLSLGDFLSNGAERLSVGKHTVRAALFHIGARKFEAISNPVEIEVVPTVEEDATWSEAVKDVQMRLHVDKVQWSANRTSVFKLDIRNTGNIFKYLILDIDYLRLKVDNRWFKPPSGPRGRAREGLFKVVSFTEGTLQELVLLERWGWMSVDGGEPLKFTPGKHKIRAGMKTWAIAEGDPEAFKLLGESGLDDIITSNEIEIEILPTGHTEPDIATETNAVDFSGKPIQSVQEKAKTLDNEAQYPWGKAVEGVQCRLRPMRSAWRSDDVPMLSLDIRNHGEKSISFCRIAQAYCEIEVDGQWYGLAEMLNLGGKRWLLKPGMELKDAISVELTDSWALPKKGIKPPYAREFAEKWLERFLRLTPGKHTVRVRFGPDDRRVSYMKTQSSFSVLSNYIEVESFATDEEDALWGEPVEGLRIKLSSKKDWPLGQRPVFRMDIRNHSEKEFRLVLAPSSWELNVDGKTCRQSTFYYGEPPMLMIGPRQEHKGIIIPLDEEYGWQSGDSPLTFVPGKHTVSVTTRVNPVSDAQRTIHLASKPIEIQVSQRRITSPPWSKHADGFQLRASARKRRWGAGEVPSFIADIRNIGPHSALIPHIYHNSWEVEVDGKWYYCSIMNTLLPFPLTPYTQHDRIAIRMEPSWQGKPLWIAKTDKTALDLQPGVHEIRIALPFGYKMIGGDDKSLRLTSDPFEIEILPTSDSESDMVAETDIMDFSGKPIQGVQVKAAIARKQWPIGGDIPRVDVEVRISDPKQFQESGLSTRAMDHDISAVALEIDGKQYKNHSEYLGEIWQGPLQSSFKLLLVLDDEWQGTANSKSLQLVPGLHTIRVLFVGLGMKPPPASDFIEIEVLSEEVKLGPWPYPWGMAVRGVQVSAHPAQPSWPVGSEPVIRIGLRNQGNESWSIHRRPSSFALEVDGKRYENNFIFHVWRQPFAPGNIYQFDLKLSKDRPWHDGLRQGNSWPPVGKSPPLPVGKHMIRVILTELRIEPEPASLPVEFEIVGARDATADIAAEESERAAAISAEGNTESLEGITLVAAVDMRNIDRWRSLGIRGGFGNGEPVCDFVATAKYVSRYGNAFRKGDRFVIGSAKVVKSTDGYGNTGTKLILRSAAPKEGLAFFCYGFDRADRSFWAIDRQEIRQALKGYFIIEARDRTTGTLPQTARQTGPFGPVIERVITGDFEKVTSYLDIDTSSYCDAQSSLEQIRKNGVDLYSSEAESVPACRTAADMVLGRLSKDAWDESALWTRGQARETIARTLEGRRPSPGRVIGVGETFAFRTREGGIGVLQLTGPSGDKQEIGVRYRLLKEPGHLKTAGESGRISTLRFEHELIDAPAPPDAEKAADSGSGSFHVHTEPK